MDFPKKISYKDILIPFICIIIFLVMYFISNAINPKDYANFMGGILGFTNKWSHTYGPPWFVNINSDISALGGPTLFILIISFVISMLFVQYRFKTLSKFLITILGSVIFLFILKYIFNSNRPHQFFDVVISNDLGFPSGHALMSLILFYSIAFITTKRMHDVSLKSLINYSAVIIIVLIGLSRVLIGAHNPEEVIAGWSAGIFWIYLTNFLSKRYLH
jgi:undecaprenyl-diphosphatase